MPQSTQTVFLNTHKKKSHQPAALLMYENTKTIIAILHNRVSL